MYDADLIFRQNITSRSNGIFQHEIALYLPTPSKWTIVEKIFEHSVRTEKKYPMPLHAASAIMPETRKTKLS